MSTLLKKIALFIIVFLGILYGYKYFTGKSLARLPAQINAFFQQKAATKNTNPVYYESPQQEMKKSD